ncbi:DNA-3-methyladenine glycosylase [Humibacillus sp. DSM 29435]|uniref:DNA-3-methyladenine glycosylase family protein n=1 Tax=Humibacillus sp. DSM 29435 TaxID=1869167 RepID=UPI000871F4D7|nr:DNA-3-methyladenine glycosylase [Humibacillus sp. DSM 29435]OFE17612.1 DNA-3-methyladenine glycosylase [Humibacillus sp. DSM 29435]
MTELRVETEVLGPWSLAISRTFWEGFTPAALPGRAADTTLRTVFLNERDWSRTEVGVSQQGATARITVSGGGDLEAAAAQVCRFLSLDVDARTWPAVGERDAVVADAQRQLPGLRPCGFHSPFEAAAWAVLSQRVRIVQAARLRNDLIHEHGDDGAFPPPQLLRTLELDLPGRKSEYLRSVAEAALDGRLDGPTLRADDPAEAVNKVLQIRGLGPFSAELVVLRGANAPDAVPTHEPRLEAEVTQRYGPHHDLAEVSQAWRPFRTWAAVYLRALREQREHPPVEPIVSAS